jgi:tetratricopeptide (TPR) repeat protein
MTTGALGVAIVPVLLGSLLCPPGAHAQGGDEAFRRGLDARGDKQWPEVVKQMRAAIQSNPDESTRKVGSRLGVFGGTDYMPYFLLGEALFELQDCAGAVEAWSVSEQQGVIRSNREFLTKLQSGLKSCAARGVLLRAEFNQQQQTTRQAYEEARALAQRVLNTGNANKPLWQQGDFESQYSRGYRELEAAFSSLNKASASRLAADFKDAQAALQRAIAVLRPLELRFTATVDNLNAVQRQAQEVREAITAAEAVDQSIEGLKTELTPKLTLSRREAQSGLARARERLDTGQKSLSQTLVAEAATHVASASKVLQDVLDEARILARGASQRQIADVAAAATQAFALIDSSFATLDRLAVERASAMRPEISEQRGALQKQADALRRRFDRARNTEDLPSLKQTVQLTSETVVALDALIKSFGSVTLRDRGVHAALEDGARFFFDGNYQNTLDALSAVSTRTDLPLQLHVHLFRAAALYGLFIRSGETSEPLRKEALAEIDRCKQLDSAFVPDSRAFSPRFIAFYRTGSTMRSDSAASNAQRK